MLTRKFQIDWLRIYSWEEVKTAVRLGIRSWVADVGLSISDSIMGLLSLFTESPTFDQALSLLERCDQNVRHKHHSQPWLQNSHSFC